LIIKDGSGVGTVKYATGEYSYIGTLNRLAVKEGYCIKYIYFALQGFSFKPYKTGMAYRTSILKIMVKLKSFVLILNYNLKLQKNFLISMTK